MATRKKKNYWYVIVMTDEGPKFVTSLGDHHTAYWDEKEKPYEMSETWAKDVATGLMVNFFTAFPVCAPVEIDHQPYRYEKYHIEWKENEKGEDEDGAADD